MEFARYVEKKIAEIDAAVAAATCKRRTALGVHYAMYAPQLVLNALITGTSLVDVGMFDETTARRIIGFTGIAIACLQALSAGFGLHRRATELSTHRRALVLLRNEFDLALTREATDSERTRLCALYASTMGAEIQGPEPLALVGAQRAFGPFGPLGREAERREETEAERSEEVEAERREETEAERREELEAERSEYERREELEAERREEARCEERYKVTVAVC